MHRVKDLLSIECQVDIVSVPEQSVHVLQAGFLFSTRIRLAFRLFLGLFEPELAQSVDWSVVNVLHLIDGDDCEHGPVETDRVWLSLRQHVESYGLVPLELKRVRLGNLALRFNLCNHLLNRC